MAASGAGPNCLRNRRRGQKWISTIDDLDCWSLRETIRPVLLLGRVVQAKKLFAQQALGSNDPVLKTILKRRVFSPVIDVFGDRRANNLGNGLVFNGRDRRQRLSLLGR